MIQEILKAKLTDYVFIRVESKLNDKIGSLHLGLDPKLVHRGEMPVGEEGDKPFNEEQHVRTCGEVIASPVRLNECPLRENYLGTPKYAPHITHEDIKYTTDRMPPNLKKNYGRNMYYPGNPPESYEHQPNNPEIKSGDKIYFEYNVLLADDAYVDTDDNGMEVYKITFQSIYCYVRDGKITMVNGWVFVESVVKEQVTKSIILVNNKPQPYIGKIAHISNWLETFVANIGDNCLFLRTLFTTKNWDYLVDEHEISGYEVEGKHYYPMRNWEIVAVDRYGEWHGVNQFVKIIPETINEINGVSTIVYDPNKFQNFKQGQIFIPQGSNVQERKKKILNYGFGDFNGQRVAYGKSSKYLYLDKLRVLFLHVKDIWGILYTKI